MKKAYTGLTLYLENRVLEHAFLLTEGERIHGFGCGELSSEWEKEDLSGLSAAPGFIDIHLHGGGGHDFMEPDPSSILKAARAHLEHGTTSILPTSCTSTNESLSACLTLTAVRSPCRRTVHDLWASIWKVPTSPRS